jgi:hypothetical protein
MHVLNATSKFPEFIAKLNLAYGLLTKFKARAKVL